MSNINLKSTCNCSNNFFNLKVDFFVECILTFVWSIRLTFNCSGSTNTHHVERNEDVIFHVWSKDGAAISCNYSWGVRRCPLEKQNIFSHQTNPHFFHFAAKLPIERRMSLLPLIVSTRLYMINGIHYLSLFINPLC